MPCLKLSSTHPVHDASDTIPPCSGSFLGNFSTYGPLRRFQEQSGPPDWDALNKTVGGRLAVGEPWSKPCFATFNGKAARPNSAQC
ncbi:hypothetical protein BD779DRAFT_1548115, partial [Infundibulicybe gibba]